MKYPGRKYGWGMKGESKDGMGKDRTSGKIC